MDITKSREEFEVAIRNGLINYGLAKHESGEYVSESMRSMFMAFKAGRESIEVELPERANLERSGKNKGRYVCGPCSFNPEYALGINHTIDWFAEALRTAGIRIKGESE
ncbi:TPA: hypothetical protein ACGTP8_000269 [Yersinia enterocolitica]